MNLSDANDLFLQGQIALAEIEGFGIRIDESHLDRAIVKVKDKIHKYQDRMKKDPIWTAWQKRYRREANLGSRPQLGKVLFEEAGFKYPVKEGTKTGRYKTDEVVLSKLDSQFVRDFIKLERLKKLKSTYLLRLKEETVDGYYHPEHHLNTVTTYRSSADGIQTIPTRNEWAKKMIRRCFIPRPGRALVAIDFGAHEFRIASSYWNDPDMIDYASNPQKDIHRDVAAKMFLCDNNQAAKKDIRYIGKNGFTFPVLYGSWYLNVAQNVWFEIEGKTIQDGEKFIPVKDWLGKQGITDLGACDKDKKPVQGTFEYRVKECEEWFNNTFPVWSSKKEERYQKYRERGWFKHPTGFIQRGLYSKKDIMNHPIQGGAFHCLVWTIINLLRQIKKCKMKTKLLCEIHDDCLSDAPFDEVQDYLNLVESIVGDIQNHWKWIKVPLVVEAKISSKSWANMKVVEKKDGIWR